MDTKKLNKWAELLLDTGKRNNLINFKDTKNTTVDILLPTIDVLFDKITGTTTFEVFDVQYTETDEENNVCNESVEEQNMLDKKTAYLSRYSAKIKKQKQMLLYNAATDPITVMKNIRKKSKLMVEETGVHVVYMAFGFICWKENNAPENVLRAPILLVPIQLEQVSAVAPFQIKANDDDTVINPTFAYKIEKDYGITLPDYDDEGICTYLGNIEKMVEKLQWTVSYDCKIGIFSFQKMNMYRDLKDNAVTILSNPIIRQLLGESDSQNNSKDSGDENVYIQNPLIELHCVVDADSSQIKAIEMAKSGKSFVLQGPPGTGKSQTITNMIAECLSDGKKVLFVSEKLAALNVVYSKLNQAGLSEFCLELHSHKTNKKDVIAEICNTLRSPKSRTSSKAENEIALKEKAQQQLDEYVIELHQIRPVIEKSMYQLYEALASVHSAPDIEWYIPQIASKGEAFMIEASSLLEQYINYIPSIGYDYKKNLWYGYVKQDTSYQVKVEVKKSFVTAVAFLQMLIPVLEDIRKRYNVVCSTLEEISVWHKIFRFASTSRLLTPSLMRKEQFEMADAVLEKMQRQRADLLSCQTALDADFDKQIYEINGIDCYNKLTRLFSSVWSRLFHSEYKQLVNSLRICKKDGKKISYNEAVAVAQQLADYQQKVMEYNEIVAPIQSFLGTAYVGIQSDWSYITDQMNVIRAMHSEEISFGNLTDYDDFRQEGAVFAEYVDRLDRCFEIVGNDTLDYLAGCFDPAVWDLGKTDCSVVLTRCNQYLNGWDQLDNWCHFNGLRTMLDEKQVLSYIDTAVRNNVEEKFIVDAFKKQFYYQWIDFILSEVPFFSTFSRFTHNAAIQTFAEKDLEQFEINKAKIRAKLSANRPSLQTIQPRSALAVLMHEGEKKRKLKSIRTLLTETGELIQRIKPCFLMSPLSVSTFLANDSVYFDVVIFDEASQIFPQDAIGAIYRAKQLIVVGDSKQMPPSNFFNATIQGEHNDEEIEDLTDFESILDLCGTFMRQLRLRWHYRSRYEQLIAFSNKSFYDGALVTFPSAKLDAYGIGVDYYHVDGVFDRKSHNNRIEAEFIVDLIYQNIDHYPERSLGVVAFSQTQQELIEKLLSKRRQSTPEKETFFNSSTDEPFFIKNLESVQGDERDTIIFSVAYGKDAQGQLLHNFGPLNRVGGERRLNVAVTRAKYNVQLVSSMHYTDIDLNRTSSEGAKLLREYLHYAENGDAVLERTVFTNSFEQEEFDFELEICEFLRSNGFVVDTQVGCSGFKVDLGLKSSDGADYVLAIECDGNTYRSFGNTRDRDRLRREILERMGWNFYRIWSVDWFTNKVEEQRRLLEVARKAVNK